MNYGLWMSAAGLATEVHRQDVIANNIANAETVAFKPDIAFTRERPIAREALGATTPSQLLLERLGGGVLAADTRTEFAQGDLQRGGALDVAIEGEGFFAVQAADGVRYTRDGRFQVDDQRRLVDQAGRPVLAERGGQIRLGDGPIEIASDGTISVGGESGPRLGVVPVDTARLTKEGNGLYRLADGVTPPPASTAPTLKPGFVEGSGVDAIRSLADLVTSGRNVQAAARFIDFHDRMMDLAVNRIAAGV